LFPGFPLKIFARPVALSVALLYQTNNAIIVIVEENSLFRMVLHNKIQPFSLLPKTQDDRKRRRSKNVRPL